MKNQLVKWNSNHKEEESPQELDDSDLPKDPPGHVPSVPKQEVEEAIDEFVESNESNEEQEELNDAEILSNARLRLEQGRLYEMLMINDLFDNFEGDPQAIKNVQREIKRFAKERMEVMLGMKKPVVQESQTVYSQFNSLEVDVLKSLATKLSGGATEQAEVSQTQPAPKNKTLTPISFNSTKTKAVVKAAVGAKVNPTKTAVKEANKVVGNLSELSSKPIEEMTYDEKIEYNRQRAVHYNARKTPSPGALPMPSLDAMNAYNTSKVGDLGSIAKSMLSKINGR